jgi:hypothetical protein
MLNNVGKAAECGFRSDAGRMAEATQAASC